jgi:hypothetical protein
VMLDALFHAPIFGDFNWARLVDHDGGIALPVCYAVVVRVRRFAGLCWSRWVMRAAHIAPLRRCGSKLKTRIQRASCVARATS